MIDPKQLTGLEPDDPRVNPELFRRVQAALQPVAIEERENFNPMVRAPHMIKARLREVRRQVIADYFAEKEAKNAVSDSR